MKAIERSIGSLSRNKKISMGTKKELRSRQLNYRSKMEKAETKKETVNEMVNQHNKLHSNINEYMKKELNTQEDEFKKKLERRRERSLNRSISRNKKGKNGAKEDKMPTNLLKHLKLDSKEKVENPFEM